MTWPGPYRRSAAEPEAFSHLALWSQVGLACDSAVLVVACEQSSGRHLALGGPLPSSVSVGYIPEDCPFGIVDLACADHPLAGPQCVAHRAQERGGEGRADRLDRSPDDRTAEGEAPGEELPFSRPVPESLFLFPYKPF